MKLQGRELKINLDGEDVELLHDELAILGFSVPALERQEGFFGEGTHKAVQEFQKKRGLETTGVVDERTAARINEQLQKPFVVKGTVRHPDGKPFGNGLVRAFDRDLRREESLDEKPTDKQGRYEIEYSRQKFRRAEKTSADLVVRAYSAEDDQKPVAQSRILFNARQDETIDLVVGDEAYRGPSEYERLVAELMPLLGDGLTLADLREDDEDDGQDKHQDITFLSRDTGEDPGRIALLTAAHRLLKETEVPAEVFYGLFRQGLPTRLPALLTQSPDVQRRALVRAAEANIIPARFGKEADAFVERLKVVIVAEAMKPPADGGDGTATLNGLLEVALSDADLRKDFLTAHVNRTGPIEDFWKKLAEQSEFKDRIPKIRLTLMLGALSGNHLPLVRDLRKMLQGDDAAATEEASRAPSSAEPGIIERLRRFLGVTGVERDAANPAGTSPVEPAWKGRFQSLLRRARQGPETSRLVALAALDERDWLELISRDREGGPIGAPPGVPGKDKDEKERNYAKAMAHIVEDAFATVFVTQRLETDDLAGKDGLLTFFKANPEFDIRTTRLRSYEKEHPGAFDSIAEAERKPTRSRIKAMQRVYKVAPRYEQVSTLLKSGLDSAHRIARMGRNVFARKFGGPLGGSGQAEAIYWRAHDVTTTAVTIAADHAPTKGRVGLNAVPDETVTEVQGVPEWSTLFGSIELCACEHCRSVHGPAAYLVDALKFLEGRDSRIPGESVKDVLFSRRPDLGEIELTCENTNTTLPYVDLVNEALENAVAPYPAFTPFDLRARAPLGQDFEAQLNDKAPTDEFRNAFNPPISTDAVISVGAKGKPWAVDPDWWTIDEPGFTYAIRKEKANPPQADRLQVMARSLQTKGSAAERAANPQYVNAHAYTRLGRAVYPWSLPFFLWWEEARAYLGHLGAPRHLIMERFRPGERRAILDDAAVAYEYLGLLDEVETDNAGNIVGHHGTAPIITGVRTTDPGAAGADRGPWNLWGFPSETLSLANSIVDPSDSTRRIAGGNWLTVLSGRVDVFLHQSGMKHKYKEELLPLLDTYFVNPVAGNARTIRIVSHDHNNNPGICETDKLRLQGFDRAAALRTVRFVRLWRALGWSMRDLDRAITAFNPTHFGVPSVSDEGARANSGFLVQLAHVQRLHATLDVPIPRLLSWWANIDIAFYIDHSVPGQPRAASLYDQLFRNPATLNPPDPAFTENSATLNGTLSGHAAAITAALGIATADFDLLLADANVIPRGAPNTTQPDDALNRGHLSRLHRHSSLAKALRLPMRDYLTALRLTGVDPFATTTDTVIFVETMDKVRESGFTFDELDYLLRHAFVPESTISPSNEAIAIVLSELRAGLQKIGEENIFRADADDPAGQTTDLNGDLTRQKLALLNWDGDWVEEAVDTLSGAVTYEAPLAALPAGVVLPNPTNLYTVNLAALPAGFAVPQSLRDVVGFDAANRKLTAARVLDGAERRVLADAANAAGDAALTNAVGSLFQELDQQGDINHDGQRRALRFTGSMTNARKARLDALSNDGNYRNAVQVLYGAPRRFVSRAMRTFAVHDLHEALAALPAGIEIPAALKQKVYFDASVGRLHCLGVMSEQQRDALLRLSNDAAYQAAVNALFAQPEALVPAAADAFLTAAGANTDAAALFDTAVAPDDRFVLVLKKLLPYLRSSLSERFAAGQIAEALQLEARSADALLRTWLVSPVNPQRRCLAELLDPAFAASNTNVQLTPAAFPVQFKTFLRLHKAALVASRFKLTHLQLGWLSKYGADAGWLDLNALPTEAQPQPAANAFDGWLRLVELVKLRDRLPQGERALGEILERARALNAAAAADRNTAKQMWFDAVMRWTRWMQADLETLLGAAGDHMQLGALNIALADYPGARLLVRLQEVFDLLKRLGMSAQQAAAQATGHVTLANARAVRQTVRAKYDEAQWLNLAKPLHDVLREKQRAALVAYLVAHLRLTLPRYETTPPPILPDAVAPFDANNPVMRPAVYELQQRLNAAGARPTLKVDGTFGQTTHDAVIDFQQTHGLTANGIVNAATWAELDQVRRGFRDADDLYAHFLIDVEMSPCMPISRIKQALGSVQLFAQRCLMNLESDVVASAAVDDKWLEWKWMKNYRVWEANRRIFLYPENWIEPELRDDKSPFFKELESELLQSDLTQETAEEAFLHYLEKLDQVARLEVVGIYHQVETRDGQPDGNVLVDILHVFARTPATPHVYFYRQRVDSSYWTAWERLDLDIEGDHLIPVVWNRRLMLFWPIFMEKVRQPVVRFSEGALTGLESLSKYWEIKLAWSECKQDKWTNKRVSSEAVEILKSAPPADLLDNSTDDGEGSEDSVDLGGDSGGPSDSGGGGAGGGGGGRPGRGRRRLFSTVAGSNTFPSTTSELFLNSVVDDVNNLYICVMYRNADLVENVLLYGWRNAFRFDGCNAEPVLDGAVGGPDLVTDTTIYRNFLREADEAPLSLPAPTDTVALGKTPGTFLLLPYHDGSSIARHPFFFQDDKRTFFIIPSENPLPTAFPEADQVDPGFAIDTAGRYWNRAGSVAGGATPMVNAEGPSLYEPSIPVMPEASVAAPAAMPRLAPGTGMRALGDGEVPGLQWYGHRTRIGFLFQTFYHPYVCPFVRELNRNGVDGLLQRRLQTDPNEFALRRPDGQRLDPLNFDNEYKPNPSALLLNPNPIVLKPYPREDVDFNEDGAYALYNWELFFHVPFLIADRLHKNQRYEEAQKWFHYIFDPTDASSFDVPERYWRTKPFHRTTRKGYQREQIQSILDLLARGANAQTSVQLTPDERQDLSHLRKSVARWRRDPFKPHLIARTRTTAYQKTVVMKYIDNLIGWGDQLFRRDTIESNNEATQLYVLAAEILGRRPEDVPPRATPQVQTYNSLEPKLDDFSNALVAIEELISPSAGGSVVGTTGQPPAPTLPLVLYFCVSRNDKLLGYWDTVADRLFKLRHCMNIEGIVRQLPLFEPPIEPGLLVKAVAAGVDLGSVLNDISAGPPHYRFNVLAQKATELCAELKSLGQAMLATLEKRDAEQLSLLRARQETGLLGLVEQVRRLQYDEAQQNKTALSRSRDMAVSRYIHYQKLLGVQSPQVPAIGEPIPEASPSEHVAIEEEVGIKLIPHEKEEIEQLERSKNLQIAASGVDAVAGVLHLIPNFEIQPYGVGQQYGGSNFGSAAAAIANVLRAVSAEHSFQSTKASRLGQYALRAHDWLLQSNLAAREIMQIDQQYLAAELRSQIADKELFNHRRQVENAREVEAFLRDKYTNQELYGWTIGQLATVYFQTYQLAYDLAKRAERAFRQELGLQDSNYVQFGYWDGLKKGLLAGERLHHDLKRMELAYLDQYKREYEITKHVSVRQLDPLALVQLRQTGACLVRLPEVLFDLDYPGHYMRRVRSASLSIPCVTGPYTGVNCTLTLLKSSVRHGNTTLNGRHARQEADPRFTDSLGAIQSIVTSSGQDDSGLFEANLRDERYLPFEGAGAISEWQLELPAGFREFDYDTISDVILHLRYTAREGGGLLKQQATLELPATVNELIRSESQRGPAQFFSLRHEFPTEWHRFLNPANAGPNHNTVILGLTTDRFPFLFQSRSIKVVKIELFVKAKPDFDDATLMLTIVTGDTAPTPDNHTQNDLLSLAPWSGLSRGEKTFDQSPGNWTVNAWLDDGGGPNRLDPIAMEDLLLICHYQLRD